MNGVEIRQCRGRPKGSRDKKPRARRGDGPMFEDISAEPLPCCAASPMLQGVDPTAAPSYIASSTLTAGRWAEKSCEEVTVNSGSSWAASEGEHSQAWSACCMTAEPAESPDSPAWAAPPDGWDDPFHADFPFW